jgi:hypothetical protein
VHIARSTDPDIYVFYTQIWLALRHHLPEELVVYIACLAGMKVSDPTRTVVCNEAVMVRCPSMRRHTAVWFHSGLLERKDVTRTAAMQLVTVSADQGWTTHAEEGPQSWFEFSVVADGASDTKMEAGEWWRSHENRMAYGAPNSVEGSVFDLGGHRTPALRAGHRIFVRVCAQHEQWENRGEKGELRFWRWFEPVHDVVFARLESCQKEGSCGYCAVAGALARKDA